MFQFSIQAYLFGLVVFLLLCILKIYAAKFHKSVYYKYKKKPYLLTKGEHILFNILNSFLADNYFIFPQIHLPTILEHKQLNKNEWASFRHINQKSVDFVICEKNDLKPLLVIELDDFTHTFKSRINRDNEVNRILNDVSMNFIRISTKDLDNIELIHNLLQDKLAFHKKIN